MCPEIAFQALFWGMSSSNAGETPNESSLIRRQRRLRVPPDTFSKPKDRVLATKSSEYRGNEFGNFKRFSHKQTDTAACEVAKLSLSNSERTSKKAKRVRNQHSSQSILSDANIERTAIFALAQHDDFARRMSDRSERAENIMDRLTALNDAVLHLDVQLALHEASILEVSEQMKPLLSRLSTCTSLNDNSTPRELTADATSADGEEIQVARAPPSDVGRMDCDEK